MVCWNWYGTANCRNISAKIWLHWLVEIYLWKLSFRVRQLITADGFLRAWAYFRDTVMIALNTKVRILTALQEKKNITNCYRFLFHFRRLYIWHALKMKIKYISYGSEVAFGKIKCCLYATAPLLIPIGIYNSENLIEIHRNHYV